MTDPSSKPRVFLGSQADVDVINDTARLIAGLEELLSVAERMRAGDPSLDPEEWYAIRDYARVLLKHTKETRVA